MSQLNPVTTAQSSSTQYVGELLALLGNDDPIEVMTQLQPSLEKAIRGVSDEDLILRVYAGMDAVKELQARRAPKPYLNARHSILGLLEELTRQKECARIYIERPEFKLRLEKKRN